ncbi:11565_t:CDS:1, partial [Ambispora gerdemannii]
TKCRSNGNLRLLFKDQAQRIPPNAGPIPFTVPRTSRETVFEIYVSN